MSTISAGTTNSTALVETGDTTGNLIIKANTSTTVGTFSSTGLAVVGSLTSTTPAAGAFTTLSGTSLSVPSGLTSTTTYANVVANFKSNASGADTTLQFTDSVAFNSYISAKGGVFRFQPTGNGVSVLTVDGGTASTSLTGLLDISSAAAGQIKFPATQSASTDANTLDDYEEGTWTPSVGGTATYSIQNATYVKIGQLVTVWADVQINSIGSGNTTQIQGLPFTSRSAAPAPVMGAALGYFAGVATSVVTIVPRMDGGSTTMVLGSLTAASTGVGSSALWADAARIIVTFTYRTTA